MKTITWNNLLPIIANDRELYETLYGYRYFSPNFLAKKAIERNNMDLFLFALDNGANNVIELSDLALNNKRFNFVEVLLNRYSNDFYVILTKVMEYNYRDFLNYILDEYNVNYLILEDLARHYAPNLLNFIIQHKEDKGYRELLNYLDSTTVIPN